MGIEHGDACGRSARNMVPLSGERITVFSLPRCSVVLHETSGVSIGWEAFLGEAVPISDGRSGRWASVKFRP